MGDMTPAQRPQAPSAEIMKKAKARAQRTYARIANVRLDNLRVRNMSKSAAGTTEQPGRNVRAKSGLNYAILDQGWCKFRRQLDYKLAWNGGRLIVVPPHNTSQTCPACGHVSADNRQTQACFVCVECGFEENADVVGAINILKARGSPVAPVK